MKPEQLLYRSFQMDKTEFFHLYRSYEFRFPLHPSKLPVYFYRILNEVKYLISYQYSSYIDNHIQEVM